MLDEPIISRAQQGGRFKLTIAVLLTKVRINFPPHLSVGDQHVCGMEWRPFAWKFSHPPVGDALSLTTKSIRIFDMLFRNVLHRIEPLRLGCVFSSENWIEKFRSGPRAQSFLDDSLHALMKFFQRTATDGENSFEIVMNHKMAMSEWNVRWRRDKVLSKTPRVGWGIIHFAKQKCWLDWSSMNAESWRFPARESKRLFSCSVNAIIM